MKKLIIFYSFEGNTKFIAREMAHAIGADILELQPEGEVKPTGFKKYIWGGRQVVHKVTPKLAAFDKNPFEYDAIIFGTPVWAFTFAPALRSFFGQVKLEGKKVALFCCHGGGKGKTLENMAAQLKGNEIIGQIDFLEPLKQNREAKAAQARQWAASLAL